MYYKYDKKRTIIVPEPYKRYITPLFMGDDNIIKQSDFSIHFTEWEPGCEIDSHSHPDSMEAMYCISGQGIAYINGQQHDFAPNSMIVAPPGVSHRIVNTGGELLRVLCIFSPPTTGKKLEERALEAVESREDGKRQS